MRRAYDGTQTAIIVLPMIMAGRLIEQGRVRVGLVNCQVKPAEKRTRCNRCLAMGHLSKDCKGPNREKCCRRCGVEGNFAAVCSARYEVTRSFTAELQRANAKTNRDEDIKELRTDSGLEPIIGGCS